MISENRTMEKSELKMELEKLEKENREKKGKTARDKSKTS